MKTLTIEILKLEALKMLKALEDLGLIKIIDGQEATADAKETSEVREQSEDYKVLSAKEPQRSDAELFQWLEGLRERFKGVEIDDKDIEEEVKAVRKRYRSEEG